MAERFVRMGTDDALTVAALTEELRAWLEAKTAAGVGDHVLATTLQYEIVALVARNAPSLERANELLDVWRAGARAQLAELGLGVHP
jgi:hypothetical protein